MGPEQSPAVITDRTSLSRLLTIYDNTVFPTVQILFYETKHFCVYVTL